MNKKILYITTFYPTNTHPHHGIFFKDHAEALGRYEDVAVLFVSVPSVRQSGKIIDKVNLVNDNGIIEVRVDVPVMTHRSRYFIERAYKRGTRKGFEALMKQWQGKPDVVIAHTSLPTGQLARYIYEEYGVPYGIIEHFSFLDSMIEHQKKEIISVYTSSVFLGVVSPYLANLITSRLPELKSPEIIPNVLGRSFEETFYNINQFESNESRRFKWIWVGDDKYSKQPDLLANVIGLFATDQVALTVVGKGDFQSLTLLERQGYDIRFYKNIPREKMPDIMLRHNALISTSLIETFGMAILEMLSLGRPVAITPSGGPEMFVTPERGIVAGGHTANDIAHAMNALMQSYNSFDADLIRNSVINEYGSHAYHGRLLKLINNI